MLKLISYIDGEGYNRQSWIRADSLDNPEWGIAEDPPNLDSLGLSEEAQKELHNEIFKLNLITYVDVLQSGGKLSAVLRKLDLYDLRKQIIILYKTKFNR